jgi:hypothetical protein
MPASADRHTPAGHVHVDHVFLAVAEDGPPTDVPTHEIRWFTEADAATAAGISEDSRLQVLALFGYLTGRSSPPVVYDAGESGGVTAAGVAGQCHGL